MEKSPWLLMHLDERPSLVNGPFIPMAMFNNQRVYIYIYIYILDYMGYIWIMNHLLSWMHIQACLYLDPFVQRKIAVIYR